MDELFPLSLCLYFPAETDTVLLFSWAKVLSSESMGQDPPPLLGRTVPARLDSKLAAGGTGVAVAKESTEG